MNPATIGPASQELRRGNGILVAAFFLSLFVNILRLSGPLFMILIYDRVLPARSQETLLVLFVMVVTFLIAQGIIDYARRRILARFGAQFQERMEASLFASAGHGDLFERGRSKPVAGLDEVDGLRGFFHSSSLVAIYDFFWAPMFLLVIFVLHPLMGWVSVGGMALILVLMTIRMVFIGQREIDANAASRAIGELKTMAAASRDTIRSQEMGRGFKERWLVARRNSRDQAIALKDWTGWFDSLCDVAVLLARYSVLAVGAWLTLQGTLTVGAMVAATFLVSRVLVPVEKFLTEMPDILEARRNWLQLKRIIASREASQGEEFVEAGGNPRARLSLDNVAVRSPLTASLILKGISFDVAPGQMVQISGQTGKGKTVLAETMMGLWKRSGGTVLVNGLNLARLGDADTERTFGYVPETPGFVEGTLADNISHLDPDAQPEKVAAAARKACLHATISALPDGYQTQIDASASILSRGQRHQLALARALYHTPEILILDDFDPMLLDLLPKTMDKTFDQLLEKGGAIVILTRKSLSLRQISATYQLDDGRLKLLKSITPAANVTVLGEKKPKERKAGDGSVASLIRN